MFYKGNNGSELTKHLNLNYKATFFLKHRCLGIQIIIIISIILFNDK